MGFFFENLLMYRASGTNATMLLQSGYVYIIHDVTMTVSNAAGNNATGSKLYLYTTENKQVPVDCLILPTVATYNRVQFKDMDLELKAGLLQIEMSPITPGEFPTKTSCVIKYSKVEQAQTVKTYNLKGDLI